MHRSDLDKDPLVSASSLPGGKSLVCIHTSGSISLKKTEEPTETGERELCEVFRHSRRNPEGCLAFSSRLDEIGYERFVLVYTVLGDLERYAHHHTPITHHHLIAKLRLFVFYIDNVSQVIEEGPVVRTDHVDVPFEDLGFNCVWTVKNAVFYSCEHYIGEPKYLSLVVVHLGAEVVQRHLVTSGWTPPRYGESPPPR